MSPRFKVRLKHHFTLLIVTGVLLFLFIRLIPGDDVKYLWSMATGYVSIILLAGTLLIGPFNVYKKRLNPVSTDLRRDIGIWCGLIGLLHIVIGIQVHMGNIWLYFFNAVEGINSYQLRDDVFGIANYTGLLAGVILLVLLFLSNDLSLHWLKTQRWKTIQRWNYILFALVLTHGILYQVIEKRMIIFIVLFAGIMMLPAIAQTIGFRITKSKKT
jgi:sulfoxide reductase heme-binding subunit YedZ